MTGQPKSPLRRILPRRAESALNEALDDTRVVLVVGPRQAGKSTLARLSAAQRGAVWRSLDRAEERNSAAADPTEFVAGGVPMVIDEVQRVPELLLAIKDAVDVDPAPGRFLLTGSARVLAMRSVPDALPGRIETVELWPLSQGEIDGAPDGFIDAVFQRGAELVHESEESRRDYAARVVRGGFPEAVAREDHRRRARFFDNYVSDLINRDVVQLSEVERGPQLRALTHLIAARSGQLLIPGTLAGDLGLPRNTVARYIGLLEEVFLIKRIPAFSRNVSTRAVAAPKVAFVDSGIAANLLDADEAAMARHDGPLGPLLEGFVLSELARALTWAQHRVELSHYRTKDGVEVDAVLSDRRGRVVGIEVKAGSTVRAEDFRGLRHLADRVGDDFVAGFVLNTGGRTLPFGPKMRSMPISALWQCRSEDAGVTASPRPDGTLF